MQVLEAVSKITVYHGTSADLLPSILSKGLVAGERREGKPAIFVTAHFSTAARYAIGAYGGETPCVIEISLSLRSRKNRIKYDPMDRKWYGDEGSFESHVFDELNSDLRSLVSDILVRNFGFKERDVLFTRVVDDLFRGVDRIEDIRRVNIYKKLPRLLEKEYRVPRREILRILRSELLPPGDILANGYVDVAPDGSLQLTENFWQEVEQIMVFQKRIPKSAFRGVWLMFNDFPEVRADDSRILDTKESPITLLPQEGEAAVGRLGDAILDLKYALPDDIFECELWVNLKEDPKVENVLELLGEYESFREFGDEFIEQINRVDRLIAEDMHERSLDPDEVGVVADWAESGPPRDVLSEVEGVLTFDLPRILEDMYDGVMEIQAYEEEIVKDSGRFFKVSVDDALRLIRSK